MLLQKNRYFQPPTIKKKKKYKSRFEIYFGFISITNSSLTFNRINRFFVIIPIQITMKSCGIVYILHVNQNAIEYVKRSPSSPP